MRSSIGADRPTGPGAGRAAGGTRRSRGHEAVDGAARLAAPFGDLLVEVRDGAVCAVRWVDDERRITGTSAGDPLAREAAEQLRRYLAEPRCGFDLPLAQARTPFQVRLRELLCAIPCGATCTYGSIAAILGVSPRAVGAGCRANPVPLLVPCHRVVAQKGLGGYGGGGAEGLAVKQWLLTHEGVL